MDTARPEVRERSETRTRYLDQVASLLKDEGPLTSIQVAQRLGWSKALADNVLLLGEATDRFEGRLETPSETRARFTAGRTCAPNARPRPLRLYRLVPPPPPRPAPPLPFRPL